jgi:hypothetical protein
LELDRLPSFWSVDVEPMVLFGELGCCSIVAVGSTPGNKSSDLGCNPVAAKFDSLADTGNGSRSGSNTSVVGTDNLSEGREHDWLPAVASGLLEEGLALLRFLPSGTGGPSPPSGIPRVPLEDFPEFFVTHGT